MCAKRPRSNNWEDGEKKILCTVLKEHLKFIQDKKTDGKTNELKSEAWNKVLEKFNALNRRYRELNQLKSAFKRMKISAKKRKTTVEKNLNKLDDEERIKNAVGSKDSVSGGTTNSTVRIITSDKHIESDDNMSVKHTGWKDQNMSELDETDHSDYVTRILHHSKSLKDKEHRRRMEMAEEEHKIKMAIQKEKLRSAILEREILEFKKVYAITG